MINVLFSSMWIEDKGYGRGKKEGNIIVVFDNSER